MYRLLSTLAVVATLLVAGCVAGVPAQQTTPTASAGVDGPTVSASATGTVTAKPDRAVVTVAVVRTAPSADAARDAVADGVAAVQSALREAGVPDDAVETTSFGITPVYDQPRDGGAVRDPSAYRASHALAVEVPVGEAGPTVDRVVGAGADEVYGVSFTLSEERRGALRSEAVARAVTAARADADAAAGAAGLTVDRVVTLTVEDEGRTVPFIARAETAADAGGQTTFDPGPATVEATVRVTYAAS